MGPRAVNGAFAQGDSTQTMIYHLYVSFMSFDSQGDFQRVGWGVHDETSSDTLQEGPPS